MARKRTPHEVNVKSHHDNEHAAPGITWRRLIIGTGVLQLQRSEISLSLATEHSRVFCCEKVKRERKKRKTNLVLTHGTIIHHIRQPFVGIKGEHRHCNCSCYFSAMAVGPNTLRAQTAVLFNYLRVCCQLSQHHGNNGVCCWCLSLCLWRRIK